MAHRQWPCTVAADPVASTRDGIYRQPVASPLYIIDGCNVPSRPIPADFRPIIHYRDLDAPREPDEFL